MSQLAASLYLMIYLNNVRARIPGFFYASENNIENICWFRIILLTLHNN